ncbi:hypothetical protein ACEWY4_003790 [Coilia grayii]|uniref:Reverse transcriptase RNase H-like domain-containing protein n=1 Tax=Coilia grayii TaxID=363190 RepID=A0ABD1KS78_9TELE
MTHLEQVFTKLKEHGLKLQPAKCRLFQHSVQYLGHVAALLEAPILAYADFTLPFRLYTDASLHGLGAVLAEVQDGKENDQNYSAFKLELLALKWSVTEKFKDYLWGATFQVFTDHRPFLHLKTAKLGAVEQRCAAQLANFDLFLNHKPGVEHQNVDALSCLPCATAARRVEAWGPADQETWAEHQGQDRELAKIRQWRQTGSSPTGSEWQTLQPSGRQLLGEWERLQVRDGVLIRLNLSQWGHVGGSAIVVPTGQREAVWQQYHMALGHAKGSRMLSALRERFLDWHGPG